MSRRLLSERVICSAPSSSANSHGLALPTASEQEEREFHGPPAVMEFLGFVLVLVLALVALSRGTRLDQEIHRLHERIDSLANELARLKKVVTSRLQEAPAHAATPAATLPATPGPISSPRIEEGAAPLPKPPAVLPPPRVAPSPAAP